VLDSKGGFTWVLAGAKAWLERGINLNLIADAFPRVFGITERMDERYYSGNSSSNPGRINDFAPGNVSSTACFKRLRREIISKTLSR